MVSALWKACAAEAQDIEGVQQLLAESGVDLEIKGMYPSSALVCRVCVVRALAGFVWHDLLVGACCCSGASVRM